MPPQPSSIFTGARREPGHVVRGRHRRTPAAPPGVGCVRHHPRSSGASSSPENFEAYESGSGCGAPLASPSSVIVGHRDHRPFGEPLLQVSVFRLSLRHPEPPAIVVDHDRDVVGVVEGRRAAVERGLVELPFRRRGSPDQPRELAPVPLVARAAALGGEVVLVPPLQLRLWRQGQLAGGLASDQVAADRDQGRCSVPATAPRRCRRFAPPSRNRRLWRFRSRARPSTRPCRVPAPPARRFAASRSDRKRVVP